MQCVHLPNSEDFAGQEEVMVSVALGFVAHLLQMIAFFLHVPLRYPIVHAGSRSKIIDHITEKIPEKEREFPLFSKGKEKLLFNYGVYLLNKNIAQLRWYCNLTTSDLRTTLPNLLSLLNLKTHHNIVRLEASKRTMSSSTLEMQGVGPLNCRHRSRVSPSPLSYSLDKGLDQLNSTLSRRRSNTHNGSEPVDAPPSSEDDGQREFLHSWVAQRPAPMCSDMEVDSERSLRSSKDFLQACLAPVESLASIINKMNSPSNNKPRHKTDLKCPSKLANSEIDLAVDPEVSFTGESIRQVTSSRHSFQDS